MKVSYRRNIQKNHLVIEEEGVYKEDYQMQMLRHNQIEGLLDVYGVGVEAHSQYFYNITGKQSMKTKFAKTKMDFADVEQFLNCMLTTLEEVRRHMLNGNCLLLTPKHIFFEQNKYYFCYFPLCQNTLEEGFHKLTEFLVSKINYHDNRAILFACGLHKATMEEDYNLLQIVERLYGEIRESEQAEHSREDEPSRWEAEDEILVQEEMGFQPCKKGFKPKIWGKSQTKWGVWDI